MKRRILHACFMLFAVLGLSLTSHAQRPSAFPYAKPVPNDPSVGTTQYTLTKINSSGNAVIMATTDTNGYTGVCIDNCGKSGTAWIAFAGLVPLVMENTTTAGHYIQIGSTTGGDGHDTGATTYPTTGGDVIGKVQSSAAAVGMAMVDLNPESVASSSGGGTTLTADTIAAPRACVAASGSGTAYTCTTSPTFTPAAHDEILFKADVANTGAMTLNVNASTVAGVKKQGGGTAVVANDFLASQWTVLIFDGTNWQMQGQTGNAASGGSGGFDTFNFNCGGAPAAAGTFGLVGAGVSVAVGTCSTTWSASFVAVVPRACTLKNLAYAQTGGAGHDASDQAVTVWTASSVTGTLAASALTCTAGTAQSCSDTTHTVALAAGSVISIKNVIDGVGSGDDTVSMECQ